MTHESLTTREAVRFLAALLALQQALQRALVYSALPCSPDSRQRRTAALTPVINGSLRWPMMSAFSALCHLLRCVLSVAPQHLSK